MTDAQISAYVDAACALQGIELGASERERVVAQFARFASIAEPMLVLELATDVEPAPVFRP